MLNKDSNTINTLLTQESEAVNEVEIKGINFKEVSFGAGFIVAKVFPGIF